LGGKHAGFDKIQWQFRVGRTDRKGLHTFSFISSLLASLLT